MEALKFKSSVSNNNAVKKTVGKPWKILVIDDDEWVAETTSLVLGDLIFEGRPIELLSASSAEAGKILIRQNPDAAAILLDVIMETDDAGLKIVDFIRNVLKLTNVRILLRTGQAGQFSESEIFEQYDINAFIEKADMTSRLLKTTLKSALRSYRMIVQIDQARLQENALRQAMNEAFNSKNEFLALMTHELRSPMHSILGFSDIIREEIDSLNIEQEKRDLFEKYMTYLESSSSRLLGLINNLLDLSKLESNQMDFAFEKSDVTVTLDRACEELTSLLKDKGLSFNIIAPEIDTHIIHDSHRVMQVFINILNNAIKFSPDGGQITVSFEDDMLLDGTQALSVVVSDQGVGIPLSELRTIFDKFSQSSRTKGSAVGTGLGLTIVKEIMLAHHGKVRAENNPAGGGARFVITFPSI